MEKPATFAEVLRRSQRKQGIEPEMPVNMYPSFRRARLNSKQRIEPEMPVNMYPSDRRARLKSNPNADPEERSDAVDIEEITPLVYDQQSVISRKSQKSAGNNDFDGKSVTSKASQIRKLQLLAEMEAEQELEKLELEKKKREMQLEMDMQKRAVQRKLRLRLFGIEEDLESENHSIDGRLPEDTAKSDHGVDEWLNQCNPNEKTKDSKKFNDWSQNKVNQSSCCGDIAYLLARQTMGKDLPHFNGNPAEWPSFISEFCRSTKECGYTNVQNLYRLRKCLKGDAMDLVSYMFDVPDNVDMILETLEMNFGRPEYIIDVLIEKAKNVPSPKEENLHSLILFSNAVRNLVSTMVTLGSTAHLTNPHLMREFVEKLPSNLMLQWGKELSVNRHRVMTLVEFSDWLYSLAEAASFVRHRHFKSEDKSEETRNVKKDWGKPKKEFVLALNENNNKNVCVYCSRPGHSLLDCRGFQKENLNKKWTWVKEQKLCFRCLMPKHNMENCTIKSPCGVNGCNFGHHPFLHKDKAGNENEKPKIVMYTESQKQVLLKILPVTLKGPLGKINTFALLDDGSTATLIEEDIANKLGLNGKNYPLKTTWTNGMTNFDETSRKVSLQIKGEKQSQCFKIDGARTKRNLRLCSQTVHIKQLMSHWKYLSNFEFTELKNAKPTILIGQDNTHLITAREVIEGPKNAPTLTKTKLGWVIHGNVSLTKNRVDNEITYHIYQNSEDMDLLHNMVKDSFSTEAFGIRTSEKIIQSKEIERAERILETTTRRVGNRWETGLLWKSDNIQFPESKKNAMRRMFIMEKQMDKCKEFADQYCAKIEEYLQKGFVTKLNEDEKLAVHPRNYYLPHFGVFNPNKPGKLRLVYDAAAKANGMSFNDALLKGPDMLNSLPAVLLKFRERKIAFTGDITDMFHRVLIRAEDQCAQKFLWRGMKRTGEPDVMKMVVMTFGATSSPCSAQYVKNRNADDFIDIYPRAVKAIKENHYVDDYLDCCNSEEEAIGLIKQVIEIHAKGSFEIRKWITNSENVTRSIPEHLRADVGKPISIEPELKTERVLGLLWIPTKDVFTFNANFHKVDPEILKRTRAPTKREVLKLIMSVFDPLGFLANFMIKAKILLQDIWRAGIGWDDTLTELLNDKWNKWVEKLTTISCLEIPRCYSLDMEYRKSVQLHLFCDASEKAFAAVAYLRIETSKENVETAFVLAKTRVSPLRSMSIPRLELQAAVMASRLAVTIKSEQDLNIDETFYWTDSKTVLCWLNSDLRRFKPFIAHRVGEIEEITDVSHWNWISTTDNVADEATRDSFEVEFNPNCRWLNGPPLLLLNKQAWWEKENTVNGYQDVDEDNLELKSEFVNLTTITEYLPRISRISSWRKLVRVSAWMIRFLKNWKRKNEILQNTIPSRKIKTKAWWKCIDYSKVVLPELSLLELKQAEKVWWQQVQEDYYPEEIYDLKRKCTIKKSSPIFKLSPYLDQENILRVKSRLVRSENLENDVKYPVILDKRHGYTKRLIQHYHEQAGHRGHEYILNELRQKFWIPGMRSAVRHCWATCLFCKNNRVMPIVPEMAPLPTERVTGFLRPFTNVGMDYFGPLQVTVGRRREKRYGVLFTCLGTRAIHLEIASSLTTDVTIMAIRRMIGRRGYPAVIMSDNGTNLRGASKELLKSLQELDQTEIENKLTCRGIEWKFVPPSAPTWAGAWERLIKSVKIALSSTLHEQTPKEDVLYTLFVEAESIVNSRPLTFVSEDLDDEEALTPNHFLIGTSNVSSPGVFTNDDLCLRKRWRISQRLADHFWKRWVKEYLPTLTRRTKWLRETKPIEIGDIVIIADPDLPRNVWPKGRVVNTIPGKDNVIRVVDVKTQFGILRRPLLKLCIMDVRQNNCEEPEILHGEEYVPEERIS